MSLGTAKFVSGLDPVRNDHLPSDCKARLSPEQETTGKADLTGALCAETVDLQEGKTGIGLREGRTARSWGDSVEEITSTTRKRVMAMLGKVVFRE